MTDFSKGDRVAVAIAAFGTVLHTPYETSFGYVKNDYTIELDDGRVLESSPEGVQSEDEFLKNCGVSRD